MTDGEFPMEVTHFESVIEVSSIEDKILTFKSDNCFINLISTPDFFHAWDGYHSKVQILAYW